MAKGDGWVYVLTNEAMPGLVKVGRTSKTPEIRAQELSSETSAPGPFVVAYAAYASNHEQAEKVVHRKLRSEGLHANKEFFKCDPWIAIECIRENVDVKYEDCDEDYEKYEEGTINYEGGQTYVGEYKDGEKHGHGTLTWPDGKKYVGEWKDGKQHGHGTLTYSNGEKYVGTFYENKLHGDAIKTDKNGKVTKHLYHYGSHQKEYGLVGFIRGLME